MALRTHVGSFVARTGTGTQAITGVGFTPKVVIFFTSAATASGFQEGARFSCGVDDGTLKYVIACVSADNVSTPNNASVFLNPASAMMVALSGSDDTGAISSMDADGFTFNWSANSFSAGAIINFIALGGAGLLYHLGGFTGVSHGATYSETGVGFRPTAVLFLVKSPNGSNFGIGCMDIAGHQGAVTMRSQNPGATNSITTCFTSSTHCVAGMEGVRMSYASMDSDGFTLSQTGSDVNALIPYLALGGVEMGCTAFAVPVGGGTQTFSTDAPAQAILLASVNRPASGSAQQEARISLGAADADLNLRSAFSGDKDNVTPTRAVKYTDSTSVLTMALPAATATSSTITNQATVTGDATSITFDWTTHDGTAPQVILLCFGAAIVAAPPAPSGFLPTYENPCAIKAPITFAIIKTIRNPFVPDVYDYFRVSTTAGRDPDTRFGGWKSPRLLTAGPWPRVASNWQDGSWQAQGGTLKKADTDHALRTYLAAHGGSLRSSQVLVCLTSDAWRIADGDPRILHNGRVKTDALDPNLVYSAECRDVIGHSYDVLGRELMIPQRLIEPDFPGYGISGGDNPSFLAVPLIAGTHSDEAEAHPQGRVPLIYVGKRLGADLNQYHVGLLCGHACDGGVIALYDANGSDPYVSTVVPGTNAFFPGGTGWATVNTSGAALYTKVNGRTYTLCAFPVGSTLGDDFAAGKVRIYANTHGWCVNGNGSGGEMTDLHDQFLHFLKNFGLPTPDWQADDWLEVPEFDYDDTRRIAQINEDSFTTVKGVATTYKASGFKGAFVFGLDGKQDSIRSILAQFCVQAHVRFFINQYGQYAVVMLDRRRGTVVKSDRASTDRTDTLASAPMTAAFDEALLATQLRALWKQNYRTGQYELAGEQGITEAELRWGAKPATPEAYSLISDTDTSATVGIQRLAFYSTIRRPVTWRESLCGLRWDVGDVIRLTHFNGIGSGYVNRAVWIQKMTINQNGSVDFEALDVDDLLT